MLMRLSSPLDSRRAMKSLRSLNAIISYYLRFIELKNSSFVFVSVNLSRMNSVA